MHAVRTARAAVATAMVAGLLALTAAPASAAYPGSVGRLAFAQSDANFNADIYTALPNGASLKRLTTDPSFDACASYSADGQHIAFCSDRTGALEIWAMDKNGGGQHAVTNVGGFAEFPDYSPDGRKIVFDGNEGSDPNGEIYVVRTSDGGGLAALTSCAAYGPGCFNAFASWSPDGRRIVFVHADDSDADGNVINEQVWVMNANGSNQHPLTSTAAQHDQTPDWSPDGRKIAYMEDGHIFTMRADGSHQTQLTFGDAFDIGTAWSPDGRQIAFLRNFGNGYRPVFVMNADGSNQHQLTSGTPRQFVPGWQPLGGGD
jgi:TolB protein